MFTRALEKSEHLQNPIKMKNYLTLLPLIIIGELFSQNKVGYTYDLNGNRNQKVFIGYRHGRPATDSTVVATTDSAAQAAAESFATETAMKYGVSVFPNPTNYAVNFSINKAGITSQTRAVIYLIDNNGKELERKKYAGTELRFDLSASPPGNYYLRVVIETGETLTYQVVKVN
jgi:hypothetical protein